MEGAQGVFLDNDWGTYPFVTASTVTAGGIVGGSGIPPTAINRIIGITKAYTTRVGEGPFPTELLNKEGEYLRECGKEYGTTTGRPRRCGWFDVELIRFASRLNGFTDLVITKLDVLDTFKEIKVCTGYTLYDKPIKYTGTDAQTLKKVKPIYKTVKGWNTKTTGIKKFKDLPKEARQYIQTIEKLTGVKVSSISNGPERNEVITR